MKNHIKLTIVLMLFFQKVLVVQSQTLPEKNQKILEYVESQIGKKVNRGECWDLANEALTRNDCDWDGKYKFGKKINPKTDTVLPGDIIQFSGVTISYEKNGVVYKENYNHHTAIIYSVLGKNHYQIAHQNNAISGKKVGITELNLNYKKTGTYEIFRPVGKIKP